MTFFSAPRMAALAVSTDGRHVAFVRSSGATDALVIRSLADGKERVVATEERGANRSRRSRAIYRVGWPGPDRVIYSTISPYRSRERWDPKREGRGFDSRRRKPLAAGTRARKTRLHVVDLEGREKYLARHWPRETSHQLQDRVIDWLPFEPDHFLIDFEGRVVRVNARTGATHTIQNATASAIVWHSDHRGEIRAGTRLYDTTTRTKLLARQSPQERFETLFEHDPLSEPGLWFAGFSERPDTLYVFSDLQGERPRNHSGLYEFDLKSGQLGPLVAETPGYDLHLGGLLTSNSDGRLLGVTHVTNRPTHTPIDEVWKTSWQILESRFAGLDIEILGQSADQEQSAVEISSDRVPPIVYTFDAISGDTRELGPQYPALPRGEFADTRAIGFSARDGVQLRGFLTRPIDAEGPGPLVVLAHSGAGVSGTRGDRANRAIEEWDPRVQFLVRRGLSVLQVNHRGTTGFGLAFESLGREDWGGAVQNDVTDAVRVAIEAGVAEPGRIGIVGSGFGGYIALHSMVKEPGVFRAAASYGAMTDLAQHVEEGERLFGVTAVAKKVIGHPSRDRSELEASSPLHRAERIRGPILIAHGTEDPTVHQRHTDRMIEALERAGVDVEFSLYEGATDHFLDERDRIDFYTRVGRFFVRHLCAGIDGCSARASILSPRDDTAHSR